MKNCYSFLITSYLFLTISISDGFAQCERSNLIQEYETYYMGSEVSRTDLAWSGTSSDSCVAGTISEMAYERTLMRINYFRRLVGIPTEVEWDSSLNEKAQFAALMMRANNDLDHNPPETWECYTEAGAEAAGKSNLAYGAHSAGAITLYIKDPGMYNGPVGHRRWILFPRAKSFGLGSTANTQALWVISNKQDDPGMEFSAYPPKGFIPKPLVFDRWSFSKSKANFSQTIVSMEDEMGRPVPLAQLEEKKGFGDNTLVWEPEIDRSLLFNEHDYSFKVNLTGVIYKGDTLDFSYWVKWVAVQQDQPSCSEGSIWDFEHCGCLAQVTTTSNLEVDKTNSWKVFPNPARDQIHILLRNDEVFDFQIFNSQGQLMTSQSRVSNSQTLPILDWPAGLYAIQIKSGTTHFVSKVLVR